MYKARVALSQMGSSVVHGGLSTFLAIIVLGGARSYIFKVFFRMWFGIIVFGLGNGFILLPVILSLIGPTSGTDLQMKKRGHRNLSKYKLDEKEEHVLAEDPERSSSGEKLKEAKEIARGFDIQGNL